MTTDRPSPVSIIRAVLKPGVPPDTSELTANEIITELRRAGYLIVPAAPAPNGLVIDDEPIWADNYGRPGP